MEPIIGFVIGLGIGMVGYRVLVAIHLNDLRRREQRYPFGITGKATREAINEYRKHHNHR